MQLLIVHHDAEIGALLMRMVKDYTAHDCELVDSEKAALEWARSHPACALLLAQLEGPEVDGLALGGALSEIFPGLQTMFLPAYSKTEQRLEVSNTKVFPEPIDGERLLNAITRAAAAAPNAPDYFHAIDILQMCCLSSRSGAVQLVKGSKTAIVFLRDGKIVHAERGSTRDGDALFELAAWETVEFAYDKSVRSPAETITVQWDEALIEAVLRRKSLTIGATQRLTETEVTTSPPQPVEKPAKRGFFSALKKTSLQIFLCLIAALQAPQ